MITDLCFYYSAQNNIEIFNISAILVFGNNYGRALYVI